MKILDYLKSNINSDMTLLSVIDVFSRMCRMNINGKDEMFLFEASRQTNDDKELFTFSLVRQFSDGKNEPIQLHLDVIYNLTNDNKNLSTCSWHENYGDFIQTVLLSKAFEKCKNNRIAEIEIWMEET